MPWLAALCDDIILCAVTSYPVLCCAQELGELVLCVLPILASPAWRRLVSRFLPRPSRAAAAVQRSTNNRSSSTSSRSALSDGTGAAAGGLANQHASKGVQYSIGTGSSSAVPHGGTLSPPGTIPQGDGTYSVQSDGAGGGPQVSGTIGAQSGTPPVQEPVLHSTGPCPVCGTDDILLPFCASPCGHVYCYYCLQANCQVSAACACVGPAYIVHGLGSRCL